MAKSRLDLPAPFGPTRAIRSPARTAIETPSRARCVPLSSAGYAIRRWAVSSRRAPTLVDRWASAALVSFARAASIPCHARGIQAPLRSSRLTASGPTASAGAKASWRPESSSSRTSSARGRAASRRCSIRTMVCRRTRARAAICSKVACIAGGSRFAVGSSRTSRPGPVARTSAIARRCFSPPESVIVPRRSKPDSPTCASASGTRVCIASRGQARFSSPKATSSSTRDMTIWLSGSWNTRPIRSPSRRAGVSATSRSPTRRAPFQVPGRTCGTRPARARAIVLLPEPEGPRTSRTRPGSSRNVRPSIAGRDLPA